MNNAPVLTISLSQNMAFHDQSLHGSGHKTTIHLSFFRNFVQTGLAAAAATMVDESQATPFWQPQRRLRFQNLHRLAV